MPTVTQIARPPQPVDHDPFIDDLGADLGVSEPPQPGHRHRAPASSGNGRARRLFVGAGTSRTNALAERPDEWDAWRVPMRSRPEVLA